MDIGTFLLYIVVATGIIDVMVLLIGPRMRGYETVSFVMVFIGCFAAVGTVTWLGINIFSNNFAYDYIWQTTSIASHWTLKLSAIWAGQAGSLVFWTALSFVLYFGYRLAARGYEDDAIVYRAAIIMATVTVLIAFNAIVSDPFRLIPGSTPADGLGLNPLLRTIWNVIHPPVVFIAYALAMVPFAIKLAGFTVRSEDRNVDRIPIVESIVNLTTATSWITLSIGIALGGYWAYIVLGWGGYWAWDPVETSSLIPWLLLTCYYHAKAVWRKNDVLRDSFLVFTFVTVLFATWTTRSGILTSVHGFELTAVSWTMLGTTFAVFIVASIVTAVSGFIDIEDDEETEQDNVAGSKDEGTEERESRETQIKGRFSYESLRRFLLPTILTFTAAAIVYLASGPLGIAPAQSTNTILFIIMLFAGGVALFLSVSQLRRDPIQVGLIGLLVITAVSAAGIVVPALTNLSITLFSPGSELVAIDIIWFRLGFYAGSLLLAVSGFFCIKTTAMSDKTKWIIVAVLLVSGAVIGGITLAFGVALPTYFWPANLAIPIAAGAIVYMAVAFVRYLAGKEPGVFTIKRMGRHMLHLGMIVLILGVFTSENVVYDVAARYREDDFGVIGPVTVRVTDIEVVRLVDESDFLVVTTVQVIEGDVIVGSGLVSIEGFPEWGMMKHEVYVHSNAFRDVFIAMTELRNVVPPPLLPVYEVRLTVKVLPFVSFVWLGAFLMVAAILPLALNEASILMRSIRGKWEDLFEESEVESTRPERENPALPS